MLTDANRDVITMLDKQGSTFKNYVKQGFHFPKVIISSASTTQKKGKILMLRSREKPTKRSLSQFIELIELT